MELFATHFGCYEIERGAGRPRLRPFRHDPDPSPVGLGYLDMADHPTRLLRPCVRRGWLAGDGGRGRGEDDFVDVSMDEAVRHAATALSDTIARHGNASVYAGSYGWASAGIFHRPQAQLRRLLNLAGGHVGSRHTYSFGAAEVLLPHLVGSGFANPADLAPTWDAVLEAMPFVLSFGGMRASNAQVGAGGVGRHTVRAWIERFAAAGGRMLTVSPDAADAPLGEHLPIRAGSDAYALQALAHEVLARGAHDEAFLASRCSGWPEVRATLLGERDGTPRTPEWARAATGVEPGRWRELAARLIRGPSLVNVSWSVQRAYAGEQPYWAAAVLAAMCGELGRPGRGLACGLCATASVGGANRRLGALAWDDTINAVDRYIPVARVSEMLERPGETFVHDGARLRYPDARLVWWAGGNPFHHHQDLGRLAAAWKRPDTVIVQDPVRTATACRADIVFPATLPFERDDLVAGTRDDWLVASRRVQAPPDGVLDDHDVLRLIAARLGLEDRFTDGCEPRRWLERIHAGYRRRFPELPDWAAFTKAGHARLAAAPDTRFEQPLVDFVRDPEHRPLDTATGRIDLFPTRIARAAASPRDTLHVPVPADDGEPPLPLRLLSPQPRHRLHGQLDGAALARADRVEGRECARCHPTDLAAAGLVAPAAAELYNARGIVLVTALADARVAPGHVVLPTGGGYRPRTDPDGRYVDLGGNPNTLTRDVASSALSQGASAGVARVAIRPAAPGLLTWLDAGAPA